MTNLYNKMKNEKRVLNQAIHPNLTSSFGSPANSQSNFSFLSYSSIPLALKYSFKLGGPGELELAEHKWGCPATVKQRANFEAPD